MKALREGPSEILEHIRINAELINAPALGDEDNVAYTAAQLNIAPAQRHGSRQSFLLLIWLLLTNIRWHTCRSHG